MTATITTKSYLTSATEVIQTEIGAIQSLLGRLDNSFEQACELILNTKGRIVVLGMGKSGHIANKIAATLASTGTPAFFVHPSEANHGDLGMIMDRDTLILISNSGETAELMTILPLLLKRKMAMISLCGNPKSSLAQAATINLDVSVVKEACPLGLAPTASTTTTLVMGDALAIALLHARNFTPQDFAHHHPGGSLGRQLLLCAQDLMHSGHDIPSVTTGSTFKEFVIEMSQKRLGMTTIVDCNQRLLGIFTDGDLRRTLNTNIDMDIHNTPISSLMTTECKTITANTQVVVALEMMKKHAITSLVVVDSSKRVIGVLHLHDILKQGLS